MNRRMAIAMVSALLALALSGQAFAQVAIEPTAMNISAPATAQVGQKVTLQARLADSLGAPLPGARVIFTRPDIGFLGTGSDVVVASATTDRQGLAVAEYEIRTQGDLAIHAEFRGDRRYADAVADARIQVSAPSQSLYVQQAGVRIPALNTTPPLGPIMVSEQPIFGILPSIPSLWPRLSFWPVAAALLIVWSLYAYVVKLVFRITAADGDTLVSAQPERAFEGFGPDAMEES